MNRRLCVVAAALLALTGAAIAEDVFPCPLDRIPMLWTGRTQVEMAQTLYEYKCLRGHTTWLVR